MSVAFDRGELFDRVCAVDVGALSVTGLKIVFKIQKTLTPQPNTAEVQIFNLAETTRKAMQSAGTRTRVVAGYVGNAELLFTGDSTYISHTRNGADWITKIEAADGDRIRRGRVNKTFNAGTKVDNVAKHLADAMGLEEGNVAQQLRDGTFRKSITTFIKGVSLSGKPDEEMTKLMDSIGYEWSAQNGAVQIGPARRVIGTDPVLLTPSTGLIGSPEAGERGIVKARGLIQQRLIPGRGVVLESLSFKRALYRIEKVCFDGDTRSTPWYADLELTPQ